MVLTEDRKHFCILPWIHLYKNMDNGVKLCCVDRGENIGNLSNQNIDEVRNSKEFTQLRQDFLDDKKLERCRECFSLEKAGYSSYRVSSNKEYSEYIDFSKLKADKPLDIVYLDYRPSNLCNLACKICSPRFSSKLIDPWLKNRMITKEDSLELTKWSKNRVNVDILDGFVDTVKSLYFAGGEPIIADDHWRLLDKFADNNPEELKIKYNTNLTKLEFQGKHIKDYWPKFKKVLIGASLDGYAEGFEHTRTGGKWADIVKNLDSIKKLTEEVKKDIFKKWGYPKKNRGIELTCDSTVGWFNLKSCIKLHKFLVEKGYVILDDPFFLKLQLKPLIQPFGAGLADTPPEIKEELLEEVENYKKWLIEVYPFKREIWEDNINSLSVMIKRSSYNENRLAEWLKIVKTLDEKYNLNTPNAFKFKSESWNKKFNSLYYNKYII